MQYVRSISGSVSKTWNSINPATLSGAIDVIVVEQEDGTSLPTLPPYFFVSNLTTTRLVGVLPFPCAVRQVPTPTAFGEKGRHQ